MPSSSRTTRITPVPTDGSGHTRHKRRAGAGRDDILEAACEVIAERGYENTRFSDVADRAGTSISTLQYLFGNREDLMITAIESRTASFLREAQVRSAAFEDPLERLRWVAAHLAAADATEQQARSDWIVWSEYWRAALRDDELRESSFAAYSGWRALVREAVVSAADAGLLELPDDVDSIADGACALGDGLGIQIALGHPSMTWRRAAQIIRDWLAAVLDCPAVAD